MNICKDAFAVNRTFTRVSSASCFCCNRANTYRFPCVAVAAGSSVVVTYWAGLMLWEYEGEVERVTRHDAFQSMPTLPLPWSAPESPHSRPASARRTTRLRESLFTARYTDLAAGFSAGGPPRVSRSSCPRLNHPALPLILQ